MHIDSALSKPDRIASLLGGVGLVAYAFLGSLENPLARGALAILGVAFAVGGIGGT